jgi:hypothetical protein
MNHLPLEPKVMPLLEPPLRIPDLVKFAKIVLNLINQTKLEIVARIRSQ